MENLKNKMEHKLARIQFGIFFNKPINRPDLISSSVLQEFQSEFDAPPINLPLPPNAPVDIPISQLRSKNGAWNLNISKIRAEIIFNPKDIDDFKDEDNVENIKKVILLCANEAKKQSIDINRVVNFAVYILYQDQPIKFLREKLQIKEFDNTIELNIRFNQKEKENGFEINNVTIIENGTIEKNSEIENALILTKDVNNVIPNQNKFSNEDIEKFFSVTKEIVSWKEISKIFK